MSQPDRLSASMAGRFLACHASANLGAAIPNWTPPVIDEDEDNAANRGTRMHEIAATITSELTPRDAENFSRAMLYIAELRQLRRFRQMVEQPVKAEWLTTKPWTTADLVLYVKDEIHIVDLKTGKIPVDVHGNKQLLYYAAAYGHLAPKAEGAWLHIVQPWADNMEGAFATAAEIQQFMADTQMAESAIHKGSLRFQPGDHCLFCAANPRSRAPKGHPLCPAVMEMYYPTATDEDTVLKMEIP